MFRDRCVCLAFLFWVLFLSVYAERLPIKTYTVADGLLRDVVHKIRQDSRGFLWFCTGEGISRFDGHNFTNFTVTNGLPPGAVNDFLETKDGTIYLATDNGLARLNPANAIQISDSRQSPVESQKNSLFTIITPKNLQAREIQVLYEDAGGTVWVGTSDGLYRLNNDGALETVNLGASKIAVQQIFVSAIMKDRRGTLWIGTRNNGLYRLAANGAVSQFTTADGMPGDVIASLLETRDGRLWAGMRWDGALAGLVVLNAEADGTQEKPIAARTFTKADGLPEYWIPAMLETSDGKLWLATVAGLCEWQGENSKSVCKTYTAKNDLCDKDVWSLAEDKDGSLWTGSVCGAKKIARYGFTTYGAADGIKAMQPNSIFENRNGELFISVATATARKIYRYTDGKFTLAVPRLPAGVKVPGWGWKHTVWQDSAGAWLIPTGQGLFKFSPETKFWNLGRALPQNISPATRSREIFRFFEDSRGDYWIATFGNSNELWRWERGTNTWHDYTAQTLTEPNRLVSSFVEDKSGNLWIGTGTDEATTRSELIRYRNGDFKLFTEADGVPDGWIKDLYVDSKGRLWIANTKNGVLQLGDVNANALNLVRYSNANGLSSAGAHCLTGDADGRIYIGSARGVDRLNPDTGQIENFTTADGLPASYIEVALGDRNGNLWFGTANGLTKFVPEPPRTRQPPTALIMTLRVNGETEVNSVLGESKVSDLELNADQKQISIDFLGLGASLGEQLKYEYRLGSFTEWSATSEPTVNFANLVAGNYQFEVRAVSADRIYSQPAIVSFKIAAPVWQRWWFIAGLLTLTALAVYFFYKNRLARLLELERIRTRIATDLHDDIGANLTRISLLSEVAKQNSRHGQGGALDSIAGIARESVASMNDIVWAISPDHDSLLDLIRRMRQHAEEVFVMRDIELDFQAPEAKLKLSVGARRDVLLIFKEAVSNAAKHSDCSRVAIDFRAENSILSLRVSDNGKGVDRAQISAGNGLPNMRARAAKIGGKFEISGDAETGTTIIFTIPYL